MFTLFKENEDTYSDAMKLRFLFDSLKHPQLTSAVEALKVMINVNPGTIDFTKSFQSLGSGSGKVPGDTSHQEKCVIRWYRRSKRGQSLARRSNSSFNRGSC